MVALKGGKVLKVFIDNPFPIEVLETSGKTDIVSISSSASRSKLAVVDAGQRLVVYDESSGKVVVFVSHT